MKIARQSDGQVVRLVLTGELDMATTNMLQDSVEEAITLDRPRRLIVDLTDVPFCDSTGVGALVQAQRTAAGCGISLHAVNPTGVTRRVMQVTGVLAELNVQTGDSDRAEAVT
ncbi:STAS domain-containing protein [Micromonospora sp. KC213]|uniref:STAS domain-containing protein n=1 Tax=Micromonospora sp. KC213 TaxID=2530378 RepID=UPI00140484FC|nr:STAS domain-containing protein [Micromonospora sp. KC213]